MPYMYFRISEGCSREQKKKMVEDANAVIDKYIGPPPHIGEEPVDMAPMKIEYNIIEIPMNNVSRGGKLLETGSLSAYVIVNVMNERPRELKSSIVKEVTEAVAGQLGLPSDSRDIIVEIKECAEYNISHGGKLTIDSMPPDMKQEQ